MEGESKSGLIKSQLSNRNGGAESSEKTLRNLQKMMIGHLPAHKVKTTIKADQSAGPHVANEAIVLDGNVTC